MIPIIIPAYEPDENLLILCEKLYRNNKTVILIDDGSGNEYTHIFDEAASKYGCTVLTHAVNLGKGRGLKTAFNYILLHYDDLIGVVTADSDGQHSVEDIEKCINALRETPEELILGCRNFDMDNVPFKSKLGNKVTRNICKWLCGVAVTDTQTGLRAIPKEFMKVLMEVEGERFEFETNMLVESKDLFKIREIEIQTIYDSKTDHKTHFDPIRDSLKVYKIFGKKFLRFIVGSLSSCVVDLVLFAIFCPLFYRLTPALYIFIATVLARVISATYNYLINYTFVFGSNKKHFQSAAKYFGLAIIQMCSSALLVHLGVGILSLSSEVIVKIFVDTFLFFVSYYVQRKYVF